MRQKWSVRTYKKGDEEGIFRLYEAVYPSQQHNIDSWSRWWHWMYKENPAGEGLICLVENQNRIIGHYAAIPVAMKCAEYVIQGAQSLNLMVHPHYRRLGIYEALGKKIQQEAGKQGINIIYGFPNNLSYGGLIKKLDRFDISPMKTWVKPLKWQSIISSNINSRYISGLLASGITMAYGRIMSRTSKTPPIDGLTISRSPGFDERFEKLGNQVSGQYPIMVIRNKKYLNWRYNTPEKQYTIIAAEKANELYGYVVISDKIVNNIKRTIIYDMMAESEIIMYHLISEAIKICQQTDTDRIVYSLIANNKYKKVLKDNRFIPIPFKNGSRFCVYSNVSQVSNEFILNPSNWFVQTGDSDRL